jgi:hypothetical protein
MTQDDNNRKTRRNVLKAAGATISSMSLAGCGRLLDGNDVQDEDSSETVNALSNGDLMTYETNLDEFDEALSSARNTYRSGRLNKTSIDERLEDTGDGTPEIMIERNGNVLGEDEVGDPDYILSRPGKDSFRVKVDGDNDGNLTNQVFVPFGTAEDQGTDLESSLETLEQQVESVDTSDPDKYFALDDHESTAKKALDDMGNIGVYVSTQLEGEAPVGRPDAIDAAMEDIESELKDKQELYDEITGEASKLTNARSGLGEGIEDADQGRENLGEAKELKQKADNLDKEYTELANNLARDIAVASAIYGTLKSAKDRATEIFEQSETTEHLETVATPYRESKVTGVKLTEVDNWSGIDDENINYDNNYFQALASNDDIFGDGTGVDDLVLYAVDRDGDGTEEVYATDLNGNHTEVSHLGPGVFEDILDGQYDGNRQG